jgi:hypothetical protein
MPTEVAPALGSEKTSWENEAEAGVAEATGLHRNTVTNFGSRTVCGGFASTREKVREALEQQGIEFFNGDAPGVQLRKGPTASKPPTGPRTSPRRRWR